MKSRILSRMALLGMIAVVVFVLYLISPEKTGRVTPAGADGTALKRTLIIDAGHGGEDGGAVSLSGLKESGVNLSIALKLDQIMGFYGVNAVLTRESETLDYSDKSSTIRAKKIEDQNRRLSLINSTDNAVLISIHQNIYPGSAPFGAQVLYAPTDGSKEFADGLQKRLIGALNPKNYRAASKIPDSIFLMNHVKCPAVLVETGFLSNPEEEALLKTDAYRLKIAAVLAAGYLSAQAKDEFGGTNEGENSLLLYGVRK